MCAGIGGKAEGGEAMCVKLVSLGTFPIDFHHHVSAEYGCIF